MEELEKYDLFLNSLSARIEIRKYIEKMFADDYKKNIDIIIKESPFKKVNEAFQIRIDLFTSLKKQLIAEGMKQEELDLLIRLEEEKRISAHSSVMNQLYEAFESKSTEVFDFGKILFDIHKIMDAKDFNTPKKVDSIESKQVNSGQKKISERWYALLYLLELKCKGLKPPTFEGNFIKSEIEEIGKERTGTTGQSFYRHVISNVNDVNYSSKLVRNFGSDWKERVIALSNNNKTIIDYLDKNY